MVTWLVILSIWTLLLTAACVGMLFRLNSMEGSLRLQAVVINQLQHLYETKTKVQS